MSLEIKRCDSENADFVELVKELDFYLALKDGEEHHYYAEFNKIASLENCMVAYENGEAIACGAVKTFDDNTIEIKRMYVKPDFRKKGFATKILVELENWAKELGFQFAILETGERQTEAVNLYQKTYDKIPNYAQYVGLENSVCFRKKL